jgi:hypothetical protein
LNTQQFPWSKIDFESDDEECMNFNGNHKENKLNKQKSFDNDAIKLKESKSSGRRSPSLFLFLSQQEEKQECKNHKNKELEEETKVASANNIFENHLTVQDKNYFCKLFFKNYY